MMLPSYIDPIAYGLGRALDGAMQTGLAWTAALAVVGMGAIACLVALDVARSRRRCARAVVILPARVRRAA